MAEVVLHGLRIPTHHHLAKSRRHRRTTLRQNILGPSRLLALELSRPRLASAVVMEIRRWAGVGRKARELGARRAREREVVTGEGG